MHCNACQYENRSEARYCAGCGQALAVVCVACGNRNPPDSAFCDGCGIELSGSTALGEGHATPQTYTPSHLAQKILNSRAAFEGERKQVTVLFCDMANSTELAQRLGADAMHALLNEFFKLALAEVHRLEGTINQFLGDGFMALFGAPVAHEDHVRRALLTALGIRQKLQEAATRESSGLSQVTVRMGLNTGMVVVGKIGDNLRMDYTAVGNTTNIAARLQQMAPLGQIYVSESVHSAACAYFEFDVLGNLAVKGIQEPVAVYDLRRARPREDSESRVRDLGIGSALVGRDAELALLAQRLEQLSRGQGGVLILMGEPGVGKSRLLVEMRRQFQQGDLLWLEGRALSFGRSLSYLPFIEILKSYFDIEEDDAEDAGWHKLEQGLTALFAARATEILPYLATVLGLHLPPEYTTHLQELDGPSIRRQVFICMRQLFERMALRQPMVLLLEDWHWADQSSIELVEHLLPLTASQPLLVLIATRPDPEGPAARITRFLSGQPDIKLQEIKLMPLSDAQSATLVGNLVGSLGLPVVLREQILHKTEGNPFFIEEVIRMLVEEGVLIRGARNQTWILAKPVEEVHLPNTIQGLILARIDRLDEEVKQVLKLASVIGRIFLRRVLEAIDTAHQTLDGHLTELERTELIRQRARAPEIEYIFKHALVQEATYDSILAERRRAIHRQVAQVTEKLFADRLDEIASLLAYHYTHAEDWEKAQEYLFKAGDQAGRMAADTEALEHFRQAEAVYLKAFGDKLQPLERAALARKIGVAEYGTGHFEPALDEFRRALSQMGLDYPTTRWGVRRALLKYLGSHVMRRLRWHLGIPVARDLDTASAKEISTVCHFMAWMDNFLDRERLLLDCLIELHAGERSHYAVAEARGLGSVGFSFTTFNARRLARRYHLRALDIAQRSNNASAIAFALFAFGFLDLYEGRWDECDAHLGQAGKVYRKAGDVHSWGGAVVMHAFVIYFRGDLPRIAALGSELLRVGQDAADPFITMMGFHLKGFYGLVRGPLDQAIVNLREGQALAAKTLVWNNYLHQRCLHAKCLVLQGKLDEAMALFDEALRVKQEEKLRDPFDLVELRTALAFCRVAMAERQGSSARSTTMRNARLACDEAVRGTRIMPGWLPEALRLRGTVAWLSGDRAGAQKYWQESIAVAEQSDFPIERARAVLEMGDRTGEVALVEQAIVVFREFEAKVFLAFALHALARLNAQSVPETTAMIERYTEAITALEEVNAEYDLAVAVRARAQLQEQLGHMA